MLYENQTIDAFGTPATEYAYEPEIQEDNDFETEIQYLSVDPDDDTGLRVLLTLVNVTTNATLNVDVLTTSESPSIALFQAIRLTYAVFKPSDYIATGYRLIEDAPF